MKKRGFGQGRWNGVGGKVTNGESVEDAAKREAQEEIGVVVQDLKKVAELSFTFPHNAEWSQLVHVYFSESWTGEPAESDEMKPEWFALDQIPFEAMWPDDPFWLPRVLNGELLRAAFVFAEGDVILSKQVDSVEMLGNTEV
jgi:8-oxo-dGTP diphosphatase / 2-hydroxy-dATP diphosphatase